MGELQGQTEVQETTQEDPQAVSGQGAETQTAETDGEVGSPEEVRPYTDEEAQAILEADGKLDSRRLTPAQKLVQKSFERGYTQKFQALAEQQRQLNSTMQNFQRMQQVSASPLESAYQEYKRNPMGVVNDFQNTVDQLTNIYHAQNARQQTEEAASTLQKIRYLERTLKGFEVRTNQEAKVSENFSTLSADAVKEIVKEIPDYEKEASNIANHVMQNGRMDGRLMEALTNAPIMDVLLKQLGINDMSGSQAVRQIVSFANSAYRLANAGRLAEAKKTTPAPLAKGGSGLGDGARTNVDMGRLLDDAKKTGNWYQYLKAKGQL